VGEAALGEQLLELGDLHRVVVGHGKGCLRWRSARRLRRSGN
jgi:hypothetical protein